MLSFGLVLAALAASTNAYWLMGVENFITTERIDPIINPGQVSGHTHSVLGGSNFRFTTTGDALRQSECTSIPIPQDKSAYWFPHLYFEWNNGSFTSLDGGAVIYYLFSDTPGTTTAFPDDFRMISGDPMLRSYDASSKAQQAVTFLCLDFNGVTTKFNNIPSGSCPSGIRAQINFPSCWDGKNSDSSDHKSHVAFPSGGPDSGTCNDPDFPVTLPRIFMEVYWSSQSFDSVRSQAKNPDQPFVYAQGDPTGYGYHAGESCSPFSNFKNFPFRRMVVHFMPPDGIHVWQMNDRTWLHPPSSGFHTAAAPFLSQAVSLGAQCRFLIGWSCDTSIPPVLLISLLLFPSHRTNSSSIDFINGWDKGVLQKAVDGCNCNPYGDPTCCAQKGIFDLNQGKTCRITKSVDEQTTGTISKLPGNNPVVGEGPRAAMLADTNPPSLISPVYVYTGDSPLRLGLLSARERISLPAAASSAAPAGSSSATPAASSSAAPAGASSATPVAASSAASAPAGASSAAAASAASSGVPAGASSAAPAAASSTANTPAGASSAAAPAASSAALAGASSAAPAAASSAVNAPAGTSSAAHVAASSAAPAGASSADPAAASPVVNAPAGASSAAHAASSAAPATASSTAGTSHHNSSGTCRRSVKRMHHARRFSPDNALTF
ncbi:hypothetical protein BDQ17DRAFT_1539830 [Cyathus striatus]|nr:hypothetical protein BDQ17DRAFT_1539830 [Cyathus striatus]